MTVIILFSIGFIILSFAKYNSIGVCIPSLKHVFINIFVPPRCTHFIGSLLFISFISLLISLFVTSGILTLPFAYLQSITCSFLYLLQSFDSSNSLSI